MIRLDPSKISGQALAKQLGIELEKKPGRQKYRNTRFYVNGELWHSEWEYQCWLIFKSLLRKRKIFDLNRQVPFEFRENGILIGTYFADFTFRLSPDGDLLVADAKHRQTAKGQSWKRTVKMMRAFYRQEIHMIFKGESDPEKIVLLLSQNRLD